MIADPQDWKFDKRPARGGWAPGEYIGRCRNCSDRFLGDKRAYHCADCGYRTDLFTRKTVDEEVRANPIVAAVLLAASQQRDPIPDSDLDDEQPISLNVRLTLGDVRRARRQMARPS